MTEIKVSVIVATYRSGDGIKRVVRSLDAQTLPSNEFEAIFVDDGSPDDTWERLQAVAAERPNYVIRRIENSGWPSKPRNTALEIARGEYVVFMDHDDELAEDALRAAYELGCRNGADAVNAKESRTQFAGWSQDIFTRDHDNAIGMISPNPLMPMNPHKMYRRDFLNEHDIRFPEGRRYMWEDVFFNIDVYKHARVISVLAESPFYHWVATGSNNSLSYQDSVAERWGFLRKIFEHISEQLSDDKHREARDQLLAHHLGGRFLDFFGPSFAQRSDSDIAVVMTHVPRILELAPPMIDERLDKVKRARISALRAGRLDVLRAMGDADRLSVSTSAVTRLRWRDGNLEISARATWGAPLKVRREGDRWLRDIPEIAREFLADDLLDVSEELSLASSQFGLRNRTDKSVWQIETDDVRSMADDGTLIIDATATINPETAVFGRRMWGNRWLVTARNEVLGSHNQRGVRMGIQGTAALIDGRVMLAYADRDGILAVDFAQSAITVPALARSVEQIASSPRGRIIRLGGIEIIGDTVIENDVIYSPLRGVTARWVNSRRLGSWFGFSALLPRLRRRPGRARLVADQAHGATWEMSRVRMVPGIYRIDVMNGTRRVPTGLVARVSWWSRMSVSKG